MKFTYKAYRSMVNNLIDTGYTISSYADWENSKKSVILRHDIDYDIYKALELARIEEQLGVKSTYFTLVTSDFYNVFSAKNEKMLREILACGHDIGLHFDELRYSDIVTPEDILTHIKEEASMLSHVVGKSVNTVSMHRPSKMMLESDLYIPGMINSYGHIFFNQFKYISDSRRRWRESVEEIITSGKYDRLHILTHAFWYNNIEMDIHDSLCKFINSGNIQRYNTMSTNITDLQSIMTKAEVVG